MTKRRLLLLVFVGFLLTPVFYFLAAISSGGGHSLFSFIVIFPHAMLLGLVFESTPGWAVMCLIGLQFPFYAFVLGVARGKRPLIATMLALFIVHSLVAAAVVPIELRRQASHSMLEPK